jgi:hypothetical protein
MNKKCKSLSPDLFPTGPESSAALRGAAARWTWARWSTSVRPPGSASRTTRARVHPRITFGWKDCYV